MQLTLSGNIPFPISFSLPDNHPGFDVCYIHAFLHCFLFVLYVDVLLSHIYTHM